MNIRIAYANDIDNIMKVEEASFIPEIQEERNVFLERIKRCPELFLIFQEDDSVAGYLSAEIMKTIPETANEIKLGHLPNINCNLTDDFEKNKSLYIYISSFAILPQYRGKGNGTKMWEDSLDYFKSHYGAEHFLLLVNEEWQSAYNIYKKSGFNVINNFKDFFFSDKNKTAAGIFMEM